MAAPTPTTRVTPVGIKLDDGFSTKITFAADTDVSFWEKTVTPYPVDGGDPIDTSTMWNTKYRTKSARTLIDLGEGSITALYDPAVLTQIFALINVETTITITYPDGSTDAFYGYLKTFERQEIQEGEAPTANLTFVSTAWDPTNRVEAVPVLASVAGT